MLRRLLPLLCLALGTPAPGVRLVTSSPQVTELVFQLGKGGDVVAASEYSHYPPEAKRLPSIGSLFLPSIERVVGFAPDAVVLDRVNLNPTFARALKALGYRLFEMEVVGLDSLRTESLRFLRSAYGETGHPWVDRLPGCVAGYRPSAPFTFLAVVWFDPPILFGGRTFLSDLLSKVGGTNAVPGDWRLPFPQVTVEWLATRRVDAVFYLREFPGAEKLARQTAARWWPGRDVPLVPLEADKFARASFTPLLHVDELPTTRPGTRWKNCLEGVP